MPRSILRPGGIIAPDDAPRPATSGWRSGLRPQLDAEECVQCLLCWAYCPDIAIEVRRGWVVGIDLAVCKGCELCAAVCPTHAIRMVPEGGGGDGTGA